MVNSPGKPSSSPYAPVNEVQRPGLVKYLNQGMAAVVDARRDDAYQQMHTACGGKYRIDAEGPRSEGGVVVANDGVASAFSSEYWYIQFSCVGASTASSSR